MKQVLQHANQQAVIAQLLDQNLFLMPVTQNSIAKNELKTVVTSHEMKPKSLQLPSKDDTVIYRLKPEGDLMKPYLPGEVVKQRDSIVVGLMLNQPLVINNIVLILKMLNGRNKMSMLS